MVDRGYRPIAFVGRHVEAVGRLWQSRIELIVSSWARVLDRADRRARDVAKREHDGEETVRRVERAIRRVDRFVPGSTCIHRSLAAQRMLIRRGLAARVVIGLRRGSTEVEGHAWIEGGGGEVVWRAFVDDDVGYSVVRKKGEETPTTA